MRVNLEAGNPLMPIACICGNISQTKFIDSNYSNATFSWQLDYVSERSSDIFAFSLY